MKNCLEHLQSKIGNIDKHFDSQFKYNNYKPSGIIVLNIIKRKEIQKAILFLKEGIAVKKK